MLEINLKILKIRCTQSKTVCLSDVEKSRLGGVIVHVLWAHVVVSGWSVLLFNE